MNKAEQAAGAQAAGAKAAEGNLLDQIVEEGRFGRETSSRERGKDMVKEFISQVVAGEMTLSRDADATINARIAQIDHLISLQLNEVLHHPTFQKLEASWRGVKYLLDQSETSSQLKIRVLNVSKKEILRDLQRAAEFDQSTMFKKVYEEEFGVFGGEPFGALIGDYEFSRHPEDIELLEKISQVSAGAHAPFLTAASAELMNLESFTQLGEPRDIGKIFDSTEFAKWKSFRASDDSKYVGLALPHILMRLPYGKDTKPVDEFGYEENVDGSDHSKYLWGNAAYALGARLTNAFAKYGWCAAIRGVEGGGLVEGLPAHTFHTDEGAAFFSVQSSNKPKKYDKAEANANARLSSQLPYMMAISRFAHYLKSIMRDKIGGFMSRIECEAFLNKWIMQYVTEDDQASAATKAQYPLRNAKVEVTEIAGKPGAYRAIAFLRPHFQLDELTVSLRLVADLPQAAK